MTLSKFLLRFPLLLLALLYGKGAQAVEINPRGLGEVLIFPYYTVTGDYDSYINLVNTSNDYKALKVRLRESMNGAVVLEFNLYLSPKDHWSAVITQSVDNGDVVLITADKSCTVPLAISEGETITLDNANYESDSMGGMERTREGFVEVIEMAEISNGTQNWQGDILQVDGVPGDCRDLALSWNPGGVWNLDPLDGASRATGGLSGYGVLVDVYEGTLATYDAVAIDNFTAPGAIALHTAPDSSLPTLGSGDTEYILLVNGEYVSGSATSGIDAVSALFMQARLMNDFILEPAVVAATEWVITFPTKHEYVNDDVARAPFTAVWDSNNSLACEEYYYQYVNREKAGPVNPPTDFPPLQRPSRYQALCAQANVFSIQPAVPRRTIFEASRERNGHEVVLESGFYNGWFTLVLASYRPSLNVGSVSLRGLPAVGFSLHKFSNGRIVVGGNPVLSNYVGVVAHKGEVEVDE